jgi:hypothetical protein
MTHINSPEATPETPIELAAGPGKYFRTTRIIMMLLCVGMGAWFAYDGFVNWPSELREARRLEAEGKKPEKKPHTEMDILIQKALAIVLPPLGLYILVMALYNSRGSYRLADDVLYVPGHPPVPLGSIHNIDQSRWNRKGIALLDYELPSGQRGRIKIDDYLYDQRPADAIFERIQAVVAPEPEDELHEATALTEDPPNETDDAYQQKNR